MKKISGDRIGTRKSLTRLMCLLVLFGNGCVERFNIRSENFIENLVVAGHITADLQKQQVRLSTTSYINQQKVIPETGAQVTIKAGDGSQYEMTESAPGIYTSAPFAGKPGTTYQLLITRANGRRYSSNDVEMRNTPAIGNVYGKYLADLPPAQRGIQLYVDAEDPTNETKFYRWEYDETYVIQTPFASNFEWLGGNEFDFRTQPVGVCYPTDSSSVVLIRSTVGLSESKVTGFPLRFIDRESYALRIKYSIQVMQYSLSEQGYTYWKTLKDINESQGTLYDKQPGTVVGNIKADGSDEVVLGYFDAAAVSSRRIFLTPQQFEAAGYFPPGYQTSCKFLTPVIAPQAQLGVFMKQNPGYLIWDAFGLTPNASFELLPAQCCDCTSLGTNIKPSFWE
ncbi:MAG TPA: DUF4249 domain-containing protein [Cyclobacteriaceae bacterium]|nr:DUF4249 domain-containing protein [Cyclobacteriaceae bacterium]